MKGKIVAILAVAAMASVQAQNQNQNQSQNQYTDGGEYYIHPALTLKARFYHPEDPVFGIYISNIHDITYEQALAQNDATGLSDRIQDTVRVRNRRVLHPEVIQWAFHTVYTAEEINAIDNGDLISVFMIYDSQGLNHSVEIDFPSNSRLATYPVSKMAELYCFIKCQLGFLIRDTRLPYNYASLTFRMHEIKKRLNIGADPI